MTQRAKLRAPIGQSFEIAAPIATSSPEEQNWYARLTRAPSKKLVAQRLGEVGVTSLFLPGVSVHNIIAIIWRCIVSSRFMHGKRRARATLIPNHLARGLTRIADRPVKRIDELVPRNIHIHTASLEVST